MGRPRNTKLDAKANRLIEFLKIADRRHSVQELSWVVRATKSQTYLIITRARRLLEASEQKTIHNQRGVGYRIAGLAEAKMDPGQGSVDILEETTKTAGRFLAQGHRHGQLFDLVPKSQLTDQRHIEIYALNLGIRHVAKALAGFESDLQKVLSAAANQDVKRLQGEVETPYEEFGLYETETPLHAELHRAPPNKKPDPK